MGYNVWVLAETYDYKVQLEPYQTVKKGKQVASSNKWGLEENVVLQRTEGLPPTFIYHLSMDNYFTSFCLLTHLRAKNIQATAVLNKKAAKNNSTWPL